MELIFAVLMALVFGRLMVFSFRFAWGLSKVLFALILLPLSLVGMVLFGLVRLALPVLVIFGILSLIMEPAV